MAHRALVTRRRLIQATLAVQTIGLLSLEGSANAETDGKRYDFAGTATGFSLVGDASGCYANIEIRALDGRSFSAILMNSTGSGTIRVGTQVSGKVFQSKTPLGTFWVVDTITPNRDTKRDTTPRHPGKEGDGFHNFEGKVENIWVEFEPKEMMVYLSIRTSSLVFKAIQTDKTKSNGTITVGSQVSGRVIIADIITEVVSGLVDIYRKQ